MITIVIVSVICTFQVRTTWCVPHAPVAINDSDSTIILSENTTIGTVIRTLTAQDKDGDDVTIRFPDYETDSKTLLEIRQTETGPSVAHAELILKEPLDRDYNPDTRSLHFVLEDNSDDDVQTIVAIDLIITDVNDEVPVFKNLPYRLDLREDQANRSVVYTDIFAKDPDSGKGGLVSYFMEPITQSTQDAALFRATFRIDEISGHVTMLMSLDYETIQIFQFRLTAVDGGGRNSTEILTIRVLDVQDTPPEFLGLPYVVTVTENIPVGTSFYTVRALDGDRGVPNNVIFSFLEGDCSSLFTIDGVTGEVTVNDIVDRDAAEIMKNGGVCIMNVLVTETYQNFPQLGPTQSQTTLNIYVIDENDNKPSFNQEMYSAYIQDTAQLNYPLQLENRTEIVIQDQDKGSSGILELMMRSQDGEITYDFEPIPSLIASFGRPLIALKSPNLLNLRDEIILTMYAIERDTIEAYTATATIVIQVLREGTTPEPTTPIPTTTVRYKDPFIPSLVGAIIPFLLLIWAVAFTIYYCLKRNYARNNKVGPLEEAKQPLDSDHPKPRPLENGFSHSDPADNQNSEQNRYGAIPRDSQERNSQFNTVIGSTPSDSQKRNSQFNTVTGSAPSESQKRNSQFNTVIGSTPSDSQKRNSQFNTVTGSTPSDSQKRNSQFNTVIGSTSSDSQKRNSEFNTVIGSTPSDSQKRNSQFNTDIGSTPSDSQIGNSQLNTGIGATPISGHERNSQLKNAIGAKARHSQEGSSKKNTVIDVRPYKNTALPPIGSSHA